MSLEKSFVEAIKEATREVKSAYDTMAEVARVKEGTAWVHIDGGVDETPAELTINAKAGDKVRLRVSGGKAYLIGNSTDPPASGQAVLIIGRDTQEVVDILKTNKITAKTAVVEHLEANDALIYKLNVEKLDVSLANITNATIQKLKVGSATVTGLDALYANINGANIQEAFIGEVFNKNAMIEDAIVTTLDATGRIVAVRINADYIDANTLKANRIILLGDDGLFHQLNTNGESSIVLQNENNSLDGSVITASSITADKITVTDLSAFGANIAGLKLEDGSIHTYGKDGPYSTVEGWYIGTADGAGGIEDNNGDVLLSYDGRDFDTRSEQYSGFTIGNAAEYMRFAGGILTIKSSNLEENFLKRSEYLTQTKYTFGRRLDGFVEGNWSVVEGQDNIAPGLSSHAEGTFTEAYGINSHSEGYGTKAQGSGAHAEGNLSIASGEYSHAEGIDSDAIGDYSHTEGYSTQADGDYAHAEGRETRASGKASHTSGIMTVAESDYQMVIGKNNVPDSNGQYAFIIGGGNGEDTYFEFISFRDMNWSGVNLKGAKIKCSGYWGIGKTSTWIITSTSGATKNLYKVKYYEEPTSPDWEPPAYRFAPDDCEVHWEVPPEGEAPSDWDELLGSLTAYRNGEVIWNPETDFFVSSVNTNHPLYQYLSIALPNQSAHRNILAVDWNGNIHIPSNAQVIADL